MAEEAVKNINKTNTAQAYVILTFSIGEIDWVSFQKRLNLYPKDGQS